MIKTKMKANEKWPQIFDRMNCLGLGIRQRLQTISRFWYFFAIFFLAISDAPFWQFFEKSETTILKQFGQNFPSCFGL